MGVVVGAGEYVMGVALTALILLILTWERLPVFSRLGIVKRHAEDVARRSNDN